MGFITGLIYNIDSQFVRQVQVFHIGRIVTGPDTVDIEELIERQADSEEEGVTFDLEDVSEEDLEAA